MDVTKGHGRIETRSIRTSTDLVGYIDFPYAAQVFILHPYATDLKGKELRSEFTYGITLFGVNYIDRRIDSLKITLLGYRCLIENHTSC